MTKARFVLLGSLAGCMVLTAGCKSFAGCLKPMSDDDVENNAPLRIPVGLDGADTTEALKVPPLDSKAAPPVVTRCLEDPPLLQTLPDPVAEEKAAKRKETKASREARKARPPGPRLTN
jgi:hypothetical protein